MPKVSTSAHQVLLLLATKHAHKQKWRGCLQQAVNAARAATWRAAAATDAHQHPHLVPSAPAATDIASASKVPVQRRLLLPHMMLLLQSTRMHVPNTPPADCAAAVA
jgi:hypothetical protein